MLSYRYSEGSSNRVIRVRAAALDVGSMAMSKVVKRIQY